ncbi:glyoxalase superfamily protein [Pseudoalteromonas luteoviolacea]|uniref:Glyoxalase n=1 Tax=Pseudoalteromonas luteoviolacea S4060-1 TaxID=1365257 RepID=A0A162C2Z2_9GAMM|nr:glyoxalase superfamily protein [Pseudoalteromonas luteoviolacea]KZN61364.1 hypothetical protein N478_04670 [Pseudoalteromonas luteoviolacea S4060-1]
MHLQPPIPILRSFDEYQAKRFYIDFLEFQLDWEHKHESGLPLYMQISQGKCVLHLSEHYADATPGASLRIALADLVPYQQLLESKQFKYARPNVNTPPWGLEMPITDPFGNKLIFTQLA